jgi:hypothetical protein
LLRRASKGAFALASLEAAHLRTAKPGLVNLRLAASLFPASAPLPGQRQNPSTQLPRQVQFVVEALRCRPDEQVGRGVGLDILINLVELMEHDSSVPVQRHLNFEMSVKNLFQSFADRERVPKIQGLVNECMTFLDDELSVITGPYEELLSLDEVIEQELILFVTLNVNKNTEPVRALGKKLLQNLQLVVGKRYESEEQRRRTNRPMFSVILDEFAPFGYRNFAQILRTARGTNTAFLFFYAESATTYAGGPGIQGRRHLRTKHDHGLAYPRRRDSSLFSTRFSGAHRHKA